MKKEDQLTQLVMKYKETRKDSDLVEILKLSEGLIYHVCKFYGVNNFPQIPQEEIMLDCRHLILMRAIEAFDISRGAKFSTFYTWRLKSHIRFRKEYYMRKKDIFAANSFDEVLGDEGSTTLGDTLSSSNGRVFGRVRKEIEMMFN